MPSANHRRQRLRRELRGLVVIEVLQIGLAVVAGLGIFVGAIVLWMDLASEAFISGLVLASLGYIALAVRTGAGIGIVRSELRSSDARGEPAATREHPYRSLPQRWS